MSDGLIVVDVQNDFCEGGSMGVAGGARTAQAITDYIANASYRAVIATKDHHIDPGSHFSDNPNFVDSWPPHCVVGTEGEEFHEPINAQLFAEVFLKGEYEAAYSGFEGKSSDGMGLANWLRQRGVESVDVCGIATDYCVRATALDAVREGFTVRVLAGLTAAVSDTNVPRVFDEFGGAGITVDRAIS